MSGSERAQRIFSVVTALAGGIVVHVFLALMVGLGVCGHGANEDAAVCGTGFYRVWLVVFLASMLAVLVTGGIWAAGRSDAAGFRASCVATFALGLVVAMAAGAS